jgi:hypothetical protein
MVQIRKAWVDLSEDTDYDTEDLSERWSGSGTATQTDTSDSGCPGRSEDTASSKASRKLSNKALTRKELADLRDAEVAGTNALAQKELAALKDAGLAHQQKEAITREEMTGPRDVELAKKSRTRTARQKRFSEVADQQKKPLTRNEL